MKRLRLVALTVMAALSTVGCGEIGLDEDSYATQVTCTPRPSAYCTADGKLVTYSGTCTYTAVTTTCPFGCRNAQCIDPCVTEDCLFNPHKNYTYTFKGQTHTHSTQSNHYSNDNIPVLLENTVIEVDYRCDPPNWIGRACDSENINCIETTGDQDSICYGQDIIDNGGIDEINSECIFPWNENDFCTDFRDKNWYPTEAITKFDNAYCDLNWDHCPDKVLSWYRDAGYAFASLTDHDTVTARKQIDGLLHVVGAEDGWIFNHHMLVVGLHNPPYPFLPGKDEGGKIYGTERPNYGFGNGLYDKQTRECSENQNRIDYANQLGALAILAHPKAVSPEEDQPDAEKWRDVVEHIPGVNLPDPWCFHPHSTYSLEELAQLHGQAGMEIYSPHGEHSDVTGWWDLVLNNGLQKRTWGLASDDFESNHDNVFNRGWIMVNSPVAWGNGSGGGSNSPIPAALEESIISNIRAGNFFAVGREFLLQTADPQPSRYPADPYSGPRVSISTRGRTIYVSVQGRDSGNYAAPLAIRFIANTAVSKTVLASSLSNKTLSGSYTLTGTEAYVRVEVDELILTQENPYRIFKMLYRVYSQPIYAKYSTGNVSGVARDSRSGAPMRGATLTFRRYNTGDMYPKKTVQTDINGRYSIDLLNGRYSVTTMNCSGSSGLKRINLAVVAGKQDADLSLCSPTQNVPFSIQHFTSGKCFHPAGGSPTPQNDNGIVLYDGCNENRLQFELLSNGSLRHITSGKCVHPSGGSANPGNDTPLVFYDVCVGDPGGGDRLKFELLSNGSLRHITSGKCVHPSGGSANPGNDTPLVLHDGCVGDLGGGDRLRFRFIENYIE